jgi:hypothetical protein
MVRSSSQFTHLISVVVGLSLILTALLVGPAPAAQASGPETVLFRAEFDGAPAGALSGPLAVETGKVVPDAGAIAIAAATSGKALQLDGAAAQASALM